MSTLTATSLRFGVISILRRQGFKLKPNGAFVLKNDGREEKRRAHELAKAERVSTSEHFILDKIPLIQKYLIDGKDLNVAKIKPEIIKIESGSQEEDLFRWWNIVWWSLPYEHAYGRQMRFIIWDKYHNTPIGLIGLQSPILSWSIRDKYLGIKPEKRDFWVNQSLNAQRIGALPPYNDIRGGKLIVLLMTAETIRKKFQKKYKDQKTVILERKLPSNLLFITTTGAYGKSSVYNRLKFQGETISEFIGYTKGSGTFHIPNALYEDLIVYLKKRGFETERGCGNGPSRKMRLIDQALQLLGFANGITHGIQRAVYLFPMVKNLIEVIQLNKKPVWYHRNVSEMTQFWKDRWAIPHANKDKAYCNFSGDEFIKQTRKDLKNYKQLCKNI
jgi:hypothetical protein